MSSSDHLQSMQQLQQQRGLLRVNAIADSCFRQCVDDFGFTRQLGSNEEQCLQQCVDKYLKLLQQSSGSMFTLQGQ